MEQLDQVLAAGGALEALQEAKAAGKIGHIGLTAHSTEVFARALELDWVAMPPYSAGYLLHETISYGFRAG